MKILIFSWRDIKNPKAGGAETYTHEIAKRWTKMGHEVSLISAHFPNSKPSQTVDGVKIYRPQYFDHYSPFAYIAYLFKTAFFYKNNFEGKVDLVIDQVHGLPLFCKFYVREKVVVLPLEVAKKIWFYEIPFPFSLAGYILEKIYLQYYKSSPFLTISTSTARDLKSFGIKNISVVNPGISIKPAGKIPLKSKNPLFVTLSRVTKMKRIEETLKAFSLTTKEFPKSKLVVIGTGSEGYLKKVKSLTEKLRIKDKVKFTGFINEEEKFKYLAKAWAIVSTSLHEGWGINIIEAAACGTPAVTYKVPGLVDSVQHGLTGLLCSKNDPQTLSKNLNLLLINHKLRLELSKDALSFSQQFNWDKAAMKSLTILEGCVKMRQNVKNTAPLRQKRRGQISPEITRAASWE